MARIMPKVLKDRLNKNSLLTKLKARMSEDLAWKAYEVICGHIEDSPILDPLIAASFDRRYGIDQDTMAPAQNEVA